MSSDESNKKNWLVVYQLQPSWVAGIALERYGIRTPLPVTKVDADELVATMKRKDAFKRGNRKVFAVQVPDTATATTTEDKA